MAASKETIRLAGEFPAATRTQWMQMVDKLLSSNRPAGTGSAEDALAKLRSTTYEGIVVEPLYTRDDVAGVAPTGLPGFAPFTRGRTAAGTRAHGWDVRALTHAGSDTSRAVTELERGASSILLKLGPDEMIDASRLAGVLDGVFFDLAPIAVDAGSQWAAVAEALVEVWAKSNVDPALVRGSLGADPLGDYAEEGRAAEGRAADIGQPDLDAQLGEVVAWANRLRPLHTGVQVITVDAARYHNAGSSDAQELGLLLAAGVAYLRVLTDARTVDGGTFDGRADATEAFAQIELRVAATADQFATIAKVRAARRLWARVAEVIGVPDAAGASPLHAITSTAMMTRYDPWVNLLRTTVACFAAGVAGADSITVLPYDDLLDAGGSELGHRLARNTQSVLALESNLARVIDPAGGSWYVERLTEELAEAAWTQFQSIEAAGGFRSAVDSGLIHTMIDKTWHQRRHNLATRKDPVTGVSEFPNLAEPPPPEDHSSGHAARQPEGLAAHRYAEDFELLRQRVDRATRLNGTRPTIFLATIGSPAAYTARLTFAKNLFEIAGIHTSSGPDSLDADEITSSFTASGTTVVCVCSSDAVYAEHGVAVTAALHAAGAATIVLAGRPKELLQALYEACVEHFIYAGCDVQMTLASLLTKLKVP